MFASGFLAPDYVWGSERSYDQASTKCSFVLIHRGQAPEQRGSRTSIFSFLLCIEGRRLSKTKFCVCAVCAAGRCGGLPALLGLRYRRLSNAQCVFGGCFLRSACATCRATRGTTAMSYRRMDTQCPESVALKDPQRIRTKVR